MPKTPSYRKRRGYPTLFNQTVICACEYIEINELVSSETDNEDPRRLSEDTASPPDSGWHTVTGAASLLAKDLNIDLCLARARVSGAATAGKFRTNGEKRSARRIDRDSFSTWRLEQRDRDLDADNERY